MQTRLLAFTPYFCIQSIYINNLIYIYILLTELVSYMYPTYVHYMQYPTSFPSILAQGTDLTDIARLGPKVSEE